MHKLREAMAHETAEARLAGEIEIDGAYFGGHVRPTNARENRIDRRLLKNRSSKRKGRDCAASARRPHPDAELSARG